jgi:hypothetical protein
MPPRSRLADKAVANSSATRVVTDADVVAAVVRDVAFLDGNGVRADARHARGASLTRTRAILTIVRFASAMPVECGASKHHV